MALTVIIAMAIVLYAAFVIANIVKTFTGAKKNGTSAACYSCASAKNGSCTKCSMEHIDEMINNAKNALISSKV